MVDSDFNDDPGHSPNVSGHSPNVSYDLDSSAAGESDNSSDSNSEIEVDTDLIIEVPLTDDHGDLQPSLPGPSSETSHDDICLGDFGKVVKLKSERSLTDHEKYTLLKNHFIPTSNFKFPPRIFNGYTRHFQLAWLKRYDGLTYSVSEDGGFCKYCVLFGKSTTGKELGILVNTPLTNFKRGCEKLTKHFHSAGVGKKYHHDAVLAAKEFTKTMEDSSKAIHQQVDTKRSKRIAQNTAKLIPIAETIIFCGKQGMGLRGHRDDNQAVEENPMGNHGNFLALLNFRVQSGDAILKDHLKSAPKNALYTSKTVQNDMICVCGDIIQDKILTLVRKAVIYSVIADEAMDRSNKEQLSITIRFVHNNKPVEKFLGFKECTSGVV